ncbi:MAG: 3-hydroxyacyl-CoA dehydrogenase [Planctomycetes bacterium]|nr:3-hydroxyacyl-CoA dehydrogenase [Planctomycetota bacterium]MCP4837946.1 3-hydroxyacyl-CoA dehydrogenase [Planctomycetota bacterium]
MSTVGILGAGAMGAGIAQVAASSGWRVRLVDLDLQTCESAKTGIVKRLTRNVEKGRMSQAEANVAADHILPSGVVDLADCELFIEAIVEDIDVKVAALKPVIEVLPAAAIIATNTSSLSVSDIGDRIGSAERTCGMHFFNPAPIMKLVEVVRGNRTDEHVLDRVEAIATDWGKKVARCADTPGFIVNRVARPYYLEAFRCLEDGLADPPTIDAAMKTIGGFRMGPFELTDFIGHDVNTATTRSVWEQWNRPSRLAPSAVQEAMVAEGNLGRKSGCGVYNWSGESPVCVLRPTQDAASGIGDIGQLAGELCAKAVNDVEKLSKTNDRQQVCFARILAAVMNEASWAVHDGVAAQADIDTAMKFGVNYPEGPFAWRDRIGSDLVNEILAAFESSSGSGRFIEPPPT